MGVILPQSYKDIFKEAKFYNHHNCVGLLREIQAWYLSSALHSLNITQQHQHTHSGSRSSDSNQSATTTRPTVYLTPLLQLTDQSGINGA
jgi:EAL domain-containing protein (putative c-di-GMP-specific phosphodiesterase class I)